MKAQACPFEAELLQAIECRAERRIPPELQAHMAACPLCSDLAMVVTAFEGARDEMLASVELPDASRVWRRAQMRAQCEAIREAGRPITAAQFIAFGVAMGLIGASFGATSTRFQALLAAAWLTGATTFIASNAVFIAGLTAAVILLPAAVYVVLRRE